MTLVVFWLLLHLQFAPALDVCHVELLPSRVSSGSGVDRTSQKGLRSRREGGVFRAGTKLAGR